MKHLPKHLRPRWRYLAISLEGWPDAELSRHSFQRALWYAGQNLLGDPGSADADLTVMRFWFADGVGETIVRTRREETERARAAVACLDEIDGHPVGVRVCGISGTIRAAEEKYLGGREQVCDQRNVVFANEERVAVDRHGLIDVCLDDSFAGATDLDLA